MSYIGTTLAGLAPFSARGTVTISSGTNAGPSSRTEDVVPFWASSSYANGGPGQTNGTITITINRPGYYVIKALGSVGSTNVYTAPTLIRHTYGGTATIYGTGHSNTDTYTIPAGPNDNAFETSRIIRVTAVGQTVTVTSFAAATSSGTLTGAFQWSVIPI